MKQKELFEKNKSNLIITVGGGSIIEYCRL